MTEESRYLYMIRTDREPPSLIRLGPMSRMEADMYVWPGVWKDTPSLNDIRVGKGDFIDYDEITEAEAERIRLQIQLEYDKMDAKRGDS